MNNKKKKEEIILFMASLLTFKWFLHFSQRTRLRNCGKCKSPSHCGRGTCEIFANIPKWFSRF